MELETMRYLMMIKHPETYRNQEIPKALMDAMGVLVNEGFQSGKLKDTGGLKATEHAHRVRLSGGKLTVTDGPFTEAKEVVGGYAIFELDSDEEALESARRFMELHQVHWPSFEGECEVRPLEDM
jgi:hypothetical protein